MCETLSHLFSVFVHVWACKPLQKAEQHLSRQDPVKAWTRMVAVQMGRGRGSRSPLEIVHRGWMWKVWGVSPRLLVGARSDMAHVCSVHFKGDWPFSEGSSWVAVGFTWVSSFSQLQHITQICILQQICKLAVSLWSDVPPRTASTGGWAKNNFFVSLR